MLVYFMMLNEYGLVLVDWFRRGFEFGCNFFIFDCELQMLKSLDRQICDGSGSF